MEISHKRTVKIPQVPNFILTGNEGGSIPIAELSDQDLTNIAQAWAKELLIKANNKRKRSNVDKPNDAN